jgi:putative endonuclease
MSRRRKEAEQRGRLGEAFAALLLVCKGYRILGWRVKTQAGEIDLIARNLAGVFCFVEVKTRLQEGLAEVGLRQRARIVRAAALYMAGKAAPRRFDVIVATPWRLSHRRAAWRPDDAGVV